MCVAVVWTEGWVGTWLFRALLNIGRRRRDVIRIEGDGGVMQVHKA